MGKFFGSIFAFACFAFFSEVQLIQAEIVGGEEVVDADTPVIIYLVNPPDDKTKPADSDGAPSTIPATQPATTQPSAPDPTKLPKKKSLDDLIKEAQKTPELNRRQKRIVSEIEKREGDFISLMNKFLSSRFDPQDDKAFPDFNDVRTSIVSSVMDSWTQRTYYERLYLVNKIWLENQSETVRFASLDHALRDRHLDIESKNKRTREIITVAMTIGGALVGGYVGFQKAPKIFTVAANEQGLGMIAKYAGRVVVILAGAGLGALIGEYAGFLGSSFLIRSERTWIDPVDGVQDIREILDVVERP